MNTTAPNPEALVDHKGSPLPKTKALLGYEESRLGNSFHEAGHAVLAMSYGFHVVSSEIDVFEPEPGRWDLGGVTQLALKNGDPLWGFAAQAAAGTLAEVRYLMDYGLWTPERAAVCAADHDREHAIDVLTEYGARLACDHVPPGGKSWAQVRGMAMRKVGHLWREIRTVAHAINENTKLTGEQIAAMTGLTNTPMAGGAA
ncbi:hypothetical protein AWI43_19885 [Streptomyces sp. WAC04657]|uniref:hypothetical protein n=1 Tax=unclassified Streptomyces TaxID=2593676 RepID=UPI00078875EA|nr:MULTISPECIES: hypothetical protein [unclassified Streptomyces]KYG56374.1 hypothetical protein AWI43_19885 [Streptomyces sp. WAC04657]